MKPSKPIESTVIPMHPESFQVKGPLDDDPVFQGYLKIAGDLEVIRNSVKEYKKRKRERIETRRKNFIAKYGVPKRWSDDE